MATFIELNLMDGRTVLMNGMHIENVHCQTDKKGNELKNCSIVVSAVLENGRPRYFEVMQPISYFTDLLI